jgi:choline dehydrogenase-like flavoprotein
VVQTPQILELSGIGNREVLSAAGINTIVESPSVVSNFQDHVLGGMVFECAPEVLSLDALHGDEYGQEQQMIYEKEHTGPFGSPGMLMGFVSYASLSVSRNYNPPSPKSRKTLSPRPPLRKNRSN